jgi:hypothetical protein
MRLDDQRTERDKQRLRAGGVRGGEFGSRAVAVFGEASGELTVLEWCGVCREQWRVTELGEHGVRQSRMFDDRRRAHHAALFGLESWWAGG